MKNYKLAGLLIGLFTITITNCTKEQDITPKPSVNEVINPEKIDGIVVGLYFGWDEWGRSRYRCLGAGLCNFGLRKIKIKFKKKIGAVYTDDNGDFFVDVQADDELVLPPSDQNLYIDDDLFTIFEGVTYQVPAGIYPLNPEIGEMGGFTLPIIQL